MFVIVSCFYFKNMIWNNLHLIKIRPLKGKKSIVLYSFVNALFIELYDVYACFSFR